MFCYFILVSEGVSLADADRVVVVGQVAVAEVVSLLEKILVARKLVIYVFNSTVNCKIINFNMRSETKRAHLQMDPKNYSSEISEQLQICNVLRESYLAISIVCLNMKGTDSQRLFHF